ncbi:MAG: hypothetical protein ACYDD1_15645 [Caulobacteraceae bacterium]
MKRFVAVIASVMSGSAALAQAPSTSPSAGVPTPAQAAEFALLNVCRPAAEQNLPAGVFAEKLAYVAQPDLPPGLPIIHEGAKSWKVITSPGEVYVISGAIPEPAQKSACMVAIYGDPATGFEDVLTARLTAPDLGFERDAKQSFTTDRYQITHYDDHLGYLVRNVMVARALTPTPDHPTLTVVTYRVDYSWLKSVSH